MGYQTGRRQDVGIKYLTYLPYDAKSADRKPELPPVGDQSLNDLLPQGRSVSLPAHPVSQIQA